MAGRAERVKVAQRLRSEGLLLREIAERMGVAIQTVHTWLMDPDLSKQRARRAGYSRPCVDCGKMTDGSNGRRKKAPRCLRCMNRVLGAARKVWTQGVVVVAIREWAGEHGEPPSMSDWSPTAARNLGDEARARRWEDAGGRWPHAQTVIHEFGSWNAAIRAAGFEPRVGHGGGGNQFRRREAVR